MKVRVGNGRDCITHPEHGSSYVQPSGREWCPHQAHDGRVKVKGLKAIKPTTPWLDKQVIEDDQSDQPQSA